MTRYQLLAAFSVVLAIAVLCDRAVPQSAASARAVQLDRQNFPKSDWGFLYYLDTDPWVGEERKDLEAAIKLMVTSTSLAPVLETTVPQKLPGTTLLRIDLRELGWRYEDWQTVLSHYPYRRSQAGTVSAFVRADWLLVELADMQDSPTGAYMRLLFGGDKLPKTRDEVLQRLGVTNEQRHVFGLIEGDSQVAVRKGGRVIESRPVKRGYAYITRDKLQIDRRRDPLENLLLTAQGKDQHDGEEIIVMLPKVSSARAPDGTVTIVRGTLPFYFLADGNGNLVNRAPVDLVEDRQRFRGLAEIRTPGACFVSCHAQGYNLPTEHAFRELLRAGVNPFVNQQQDARTLQEYFLSEVTKEISRANDDQQTMVELVTGMPAIDVAKAFKRAVDRYDAPLGMVEVAEEYYSYGWEVHDVVAAIEMAANEARIGGRLAGIARDLKIDRVAFEEQHLLLLSEIQRWIGK